MSAPRAQTLPTAGPCDSGDGPRAPVPTARGRSELPAPGACALARWPVIGRHAGYRWWQIETSDGGVGWVWDSAVTVTGDVLAVPLVEAPPLNGNVPRTDAVWEMTGARVCLPTPAPMPSLPTATPDTAGVEWDYEDEGWALPLNISQAGRRNPRLRWAATSCSCGRIALTVLPSAAVRTVAGRSRLSANLLFTRRYETDLRRAAHTALYAAARGPHSRRPLRLLARRRRQPSLSATSPLLPLALRRMDGAPALGAT